MERLEKDGMRDLLNDAGLNEPSKEFEHNVMRAIRQTVSQSDIAYRPLISKKGWTISSLVILSIFSLVWILSENSVSMFNKISIDYIPQFTLETNIFARVRFYDTAVYGILFFAIMFFIQFSLIRKKINTTFLS